MLPHDSWRDRASPARSEGAEDQDPASLDSLIWMLFTTAKTFRLLPKAGCTGRLSGDGCMFR